MIICFWNYFQCNWNIIRFILKVERMRFSALFNWAENRFQTFVQNWRHLLQKYLHFPDRNGRYCLDPNALNSIFWISLFASLQCEFIRQEISFQFIYGQYLANAKNHLSDVALFLVLFRSHSNVMSRESICW